MIRSTTFKLTFTLEDKVDVTIKKEDGNIVAFSVNYRTKINEKWHNVIRYDTAHSTIHVHKFWISEKIIPFICATTDMKAAIIDMKTAIIEATKDIKLNWKMYKSHLIEKVKRNGR